LTIPRLRNVDAYHDATRAAVVGLSINLALGVIKLAGGIAAHSFALIADSVNSLGDVLTSAVVVFAFRIAQRPPNPRHPYGHMRAEAVAGSNMALLVVFSAVMIAWEAIEHLTDQHPVPPVWALWIAGGNVVIKELLFHYKTRIGRRTGSAALLANAWDHRSDALCSLAVLIGLALIRFGGPAWISADEIASLVVAAAIIWSGGRLFWSSSRELLDMQADDELVAEVRRTAESVPEVRAIETLLVRKAGLEFFVDIHIEVDEHLTVAAGHLIGHQVKDRLLSEFPAIRDVLVHLEPYPHPDG